MSGFKLTNKVSVEWSKEVLEAEILRLLATHGPTNPSELRHRLHKPWNRALYLRVPRYLKSLEGRGKVVKTRDGNWDLPGRGGLNEARSKPDIAAPPRPYGTDREWEMIANVLGESSNGLSARVLRSRLPRTPYSRILLILRSMREYGLLRKEGEKRTCLWKLA